MNTKLDDLFFPYYVKGEDINNLQVKNQYDVNANLIITEWAIYFGKRRPNNVCKGQFRSILRSLYNAWVLEVKKLEHPAKAVKHVKKPIPKRKDETKPKVNKKKGKKK